MKTQKIKRYRLGVSRNFPITHPKKGKPTYFIEKIQLSLNLLMEAPGDFVIDLDHKLHTCRANYPLWEKRMAEVQAGRAVIELFYWSGKPYHKDENGIGQVVFATLNKDSGCGIQELDLSLFVSHKMAFANSTNPEYTSAVPILPSLIAQNDGLSLDDFKAWFKSYDLSNTMAIIHFTSFRY